MTRNKKPAPQHGHIDVGCFCWECKCRMRTVHPGTFLTRNLLNHGKEKSIGTLPAVNILGRLRRA